jgi:hypothetical protein
VSSYITVSAAQQLLPLFDIYFSSLALVWDSVTILADRGVLLESLMPASNKCVVMSRAHGLLFQAKLSEFACRPQAIVPVSADRSVVL